MKMRSNRPYLLRAFFDWIVDNDCTPYIVVDAHHPGVEVPQSYVTDGQIVLNVAPRAVSNFILDLEILAFSTRFGGMPIDIQVPVTAVVGIYSQENGQGMVFEHEPSDDLPPTPPSGPKAVKKTSTQSPASPSDKAPKKIKPSLRVIK
ncbi:ClpXP protease specificity-enhancing factor [Porticoccaceae bacterium]|nr:ClpXP protease specificity-enhancing factor [Porticoccaceae bacterium]MDB4260180.1 ClpXP protease specificity-enhancing factor [Porticoccaceae bacterium]MDB9804874.1 ClpXP protease specificity-enhancing factor [Porticoccaceae bacterium]MDB9949127.1 ClpXP protease specificity-enhancing factor [Porticoccaceae bacterium]MDB9970395.1 ClpXP protease specificity-enhancing factor [Porticoccaceae bacterium]